MTTATAMTPVEIQQRLDFLAKREVRIRSTPTTDPDAILSEDQVLESIRQERLDLAKQLKEFDNQREADRQAKADAKVAARDEALEEAEKLRRSLLKRVAQFEKFAGDLLEMQRLDHVAQTADKHLQAHHDERAMGLASRHQSEGVERLRVALTNHFGAELFGLPAFAANKNAGFRIESVISQAEFRRY